MRKLQLAVLFAAVVVIAASGCDDNPTAPLAAFQPEIVNSPDNFAFQATAVENVSTSLTYTWQNSGSRASVDHSSAVSSGAASVDVYDSNDSLRYSSDLVASANDSSSVGATGDWRIVVTLTGTHGTLNFRVQKL